jgi:hypothetical protein
MRKNILIISFVLMAIFAMGQKMHPVSPRQPWTNIGTITTSTTTPAATARDYSTMAAMSPTAIAHWKIPYDLDSLELRFQTTANADSNVLEMWLARGHYYDDGSTEDSFTLATILTLTGGSQTGPNSNYFVDTITETSNTWIASSTIIDSGNNRICRYKFKPCGYSEIIFVDTTIAEEGTTTVYIDGSWFYEGYD